VAKKQTAIQPVDRDAEVSRLIRKAHNDPQANTSLWQLLDEEGRILADNPVRSLLNSQEQRR
jgi:hypothetical protein